MPKYHAGNFLQVNRDIFNGEYGNLSRNAKWLYVVLCELEHRYTNGGNRTGFFRSQNDLSRDSKMSLRTMRKARSELIDNGIIEIYQDHWRNSDTGKLSEKHITVYRILV